MKKIFKTALLTAAVVMTGACSKEIENGSQVSDNVVSLSISNDYADAKSGVERSIVADFSLETGIEGLVLEESVTSIDGENAWYATKGTPVYTENFADVYAAGFNAIKVIGATKGDLTDFYPATFTKREDSDRWFHKYEKALPEEATFYFMAPAEKPAYIGDATCEDGTVTFSLVPENYPTTAVDQKDILFATADVVPSSTASVNFYHAFAQVKFKQGGTDNSIQITKVEMTNLLTSGSCTVTPGAGSKSEIAAWSQTEKSYADFSQTYDGKISYDESKKYFGSSFYNDATDENNLNINGDEKATTTFMCVPQIFSSADAKQVEVTITYTRNGETKTVKTNFSKALNGKSWEPGKLYTYTFTITELGIKIDDNVVGNVKDNLVITNTGNCVGYIRGCVVANWVKDIDGDPVVVRSCDPRTEGTLMVSADNWIPGIDGYFYYKYGVKGGNTTKQTFKYTAATPPVDGAYLEIDIIGQIVADRSAWNATLPGGLSNDVEN